jgi:hypothetical protein
MIGSKIYGLRGARHKPLGGLSWLSCVAAVARSLGNALAWYEKIC